MLKSFHVKALFLLALATLPALAANSAWTLADFNGDNHPDLARLAVTRPGVLLPVDLDHDADLDLVLHEALTHRPVAVWLNDGRGRFTRDASPRRLPAENPSRWQASPRPAPPCLHVPPAAELLPLHAASSACPVLVPPHPPSRLLSRPLESPAARGPPSLLS
jgi:hypothetical protein